MARRGGDIKFRIVAEPDPNAIAKAIAELGDAGKDFRPLWLRLQPILNRGIIEIVKSKGALLGFPWRPGPQYYRRRKNNRGRGTTQFIYTGRLLTLLQNMADSTVRMTKMQLSMGSHDIPYARPLHWKDLRFMGWSETMKRELGLEYTRWGQELIDAALQKMVKEGEAGRGK